MDTGWICLPYPPSANRYWRRAGSRLHRSNEATDYIRQASAMAAGHGCATGDVLVVVEIHRPARRGDLDNRLKVLLDALRGVLYADDSQVASLVASRHESPRKGFARVRVSTIPAQGEAQP
jgi:crossover junction endodeoxyribonuclease RusA